jgi:hypothetical protein
LATLGAVSDNPRNSQAHHSDILDMFRHGPARYQAPIPPLPKERSFPATAPYDLPISDLSGLWLKVECSCGSGKYLAMRRLAEIGWTVTLREVITRPRCKACHERPKALTLIDHPQQDTNVYGFSAKGLPLQPVLI